MGPFPQEMVDAANEQMDYFVGQLEQRGVIVERIDIQDFMLNKPLPSPLGWVQQNAHGVNNVRDVTMIPDSMVMDGDNLLAPRAEEDLGPAFVDVAVG